MAKDKMTGDFLSALPEVDGSSTMASPIDRVKNGFTNFVRHEQDDAIVEFQVRPSDYHVEMIILYLKGNPSGGFRSGSGISRSKLEAAE